MKWRNDRLEVDLFIEVGWDIELDKLVSSAVAHTTKLIHYSRDVIDEALKRLDNEKLPLFK